MKNPATGRDSLLSRTSTVDGSLHLNIGLRAAYDAQKRAQKRFEKMRRSAEQARKSMERLRKPGR
jgi:hypothetical protein